MRAFETLRLRCAARWDAHRVRALLGLLLAFASSTAAGEARAAWSLTDVQRRAYLEYYAPIIMKRTDENNLAEFGLDWITNYDFDRDGNYSTNKGSWEDIHQYVLTADDPASAPPEYDFTQWRVAPTLYTALIEYMEDDDHKVLVLLYHVYHAKEQWDVHDWERFEIRIRNVDGTPGGGQEVPEFVVITEHSKHSHRPFGDGDLNFHTTPHGMHAMVWQAEWSFDDDIDIDIDLDSGIEFTTDFTMQELRFVEDSFSHLADDIAIDDDADVNVNGTSKSKNVNYVFVPGSDPDAVAYWNAEEIDWPGAYDLAARKKEQVDWDDVPRIQYELQDLADILPSHWNGRRCDPNGENCTAPPVCDDEVGENPHWRCDKVIRIRLEQAMRDEVGKVVVPYGKQTFYRYSLDQDDPDGLGESQGYPKKHWFWGAYKLGRTGNFMTSARDDGRAGSDGVLRREANGFSDSHGDPQMSTYMWQHDYFAHTGDRVDSMPEDGGWLAGDWHTEAAGGFDGRWVQLFPDPVSVPEPGLFVSILLGWGMLARCRRTRNEAEWKIRSQTAARSCSARRFSSSRRSPSPSA